MCVYTSSTYIRSWAITFFYLRHYNLIIIWRRDGGCEWATHNNTSHCVYLLCIIIKRSVDRVVVTHVKRIFTRGCCCGCIYNILYTCVYNNAVLVIIVINNNSIIQQTNSTCRYVVVAGNGLHLPHHLPRLIHRHWCTSTI